MPLISTFAGAALRPFGFTSGAGEPPAAFELISTQLLSSTIASVSFTSLPSNYKHLQLRIVGRQNSSYSYPTGQIIFNSDSGANYAWHRLQGAGGSLGSVGVASQNNMNFGMFDDAASTANAYAATIVDILDAFSTNKYKTIKTLGGNAEPRVDMRSGLWLSSSAISSITITGDGSWVSGSRFSLYGVKGI